jgi:hypothetical protein
MPKVSSLASVTVVGLSVTDLSPAFVVAVVVALLFVVVAGALAFQTD